MGANVTAGIYDLTYRTIHFVQVYGKPNLLPLRGEEL